MKHATSIEDKFSHSNFQLGKNLFWIWLVIGLPFSAIMAFIGPVLTHSTVHNRSLTLIEKLSIFSFITHPFLIIFSLLILHIAISSKNKTAAIISALLPLLSINTVVVGTILYALFS